MSSVKSITQSIAEFMLWLVVLGALIIATLGAWMQHFITSISEEMWVMLVIGVIIPPLGWLHGWLIWLGIL